jgi:hypothetical protein
MRRSKTRLDTIAIRVDDPNFETNKRRYLFAAGLSVRF